MKELHLVIDAQIPFMKGFAEKLGKVDYIPGSEIKAEDVRNADVLIVRTRTHCNRELLEGSQVKFIATATIGFDHIDTEYLKQVGIAWTNCPGCNASSVAQYVECSLLQLDAHGCWDEESDSCIQPLQQKISKPVDRSVFSRLTLGIIGVGHVGTQVERMAERLGFKRILLCDPPRSLKEHDTDSFCSLEYLARESDVITFHTPLTQPPLPFATYHMADKAFLSKLKPTAVLINSSRGEVVCNQALSQALKEQRLKAAVIDTWENEPRIDAELLHRAYIATPHIAGYSADGKANGSRMSLQAVARFFGMDEHLFDTLQAPALPEGYEYNTALSNGKWIPELANYDPSRDTLDLLAHPEHFEKLRGNYPLRRER